MRTALMPGGRPVLRTVPPVDQRDSGS
jgi:hypothetical protein